MIGTIYLRTDNRPHGDGPCSVARRKVKHGRRVRWVGFAAGVHEPDGVIAAAVIDSSEIGSWLADQGLKRATAAATPRVRKRRRK